MVQVTQSPLTAHHKGTCHFSIEFAPSVSNSLFFDYFRSDLITATHFHDTCRFQIRIARQPPSKTVYQRILKPFPTVMLLSGQDNDSNLFVEATLLRSDNEVRAPLSFAALRNLSTRTNTHRCADAIASVRGRESDRQNHERCVRRVQEAQDPLNVAAAGNALPATIHAQEVRWPRFTTFELHQ
jgi:hypothetical protein